MSARFFFVWRLAFGTASMLSEVVAVAGVAEDVGAGLLLVIWRRALKDEMKSTARGESPRRLLKCETASSLESVLA